MARTTDHPSIWFDIAQVFQLRIPRLPHFSIWPARKPLDPHELHSRRSFVQGAVARNPEAFSGELDLEVMMQYYPGG